MNDWFPHEDIALEHKVKLSPDCEKDYMFLKR